MDKSGFPIPWKEALEGSKLARLAEDAEMLKLKGRFASASYVSLNA